MTGTKSQIVTSVFILGGSQQISELTQSRDWLELQQHRVAAPLCTLVVQLRFHQKKKGKGRCESSLAFPEGAVRFPNERVYFSEILNRWHP